MGVGKVQLDLPVGCLGKPPTHGRTTQKELADGWNLITPI